MNRVRIEGNWKQFRRNGIPQWNQLNENPLAGRIQETSGISDDEVEREGTDWQQRLNEIIRAAE